MRTDLHLSQGQMIAYGALASSWFMVDYLLQGYAIDADEREWMKNNRKNVCFQVGSEKELQEIADKANEVGLMVYVLDDERYTVFDGDHLQIPTCLAIGPDACDKIDEIVHNFGLRFLN